MKRFFSRHSKSSAFIFTLTLHAVMLIMATGFVAFKHFIKPPPEFIGHQVEHIRPHLPTKLRPPKTSSSRKAPCPSITQRPERITSIKPVDVTLPPVAMIGLPIKGYREQGNDGVSISFDTSFDFFKSKAKGEKVCFIVHFGPATIGKTPYSRMTGYTIRKRLEEIVTGLPEYALFNVACYWASDTCAISPNMMLATPTNKQKVMNWMAPVNPLEGKYKHCFVWQDAGARVKTARNHWPTRVDNLPFYSPKWVFPYTVPDEVEQKYLGNIKYTHWGRAVAWSLLTQKPDTIFVLTTNYIDGWGGGSKGEPGKMVAGYKKMLLDVYGPDKDRWPTINVVVLAHADKGKSSALNILNTQFGPIVRSFNGDGSVIGDISEFMNDAEKKLMKKYKSDHTD
jgi:hypothetical protein